VNKLDVNDCGVAHLTLILLLHYLVKSRSRSLAVYNDEFRSSAVWMMMRGWCSWTAAVIVCFHCDGCRGRLYATAVTPPRATFGHSAFFSGKYSLTPNSRITATATRRSVRNI